MVNLNNKRKILVSIKIIFIIFLMYIQIINGKESYFGDLEDKIIVTFGAIKSLFIPYLVLSIFSDLIPNKEKREIFNIRVFFSFVFLMFLFNIQFLYYVERFPKENLEKSIFVYFYTKKHLGILFTMLYYNFFFLVPFSINVAITGIILFFSSFILFGKVIGNLFRIIINYYSKENRDKRKEIKKLIIEKKRIKKQILEKERIEKAEKIRLSKIEEEEKRKREEKIGKLRIEIEEKKEIKTPSVVKIQLNLQGIEIKKPEKILDKESTVENGNLDDTLKPSSTNEVATEQLYFDFK
jgi:hypothetical protein